MKSMRGREMSKARSDKMRDGNTRLPQQCGGGNEIVLGKKCSEPNRPPSCVLLELRRIWFRGVSRTKTRWLVGGDG